LKDPDDKDRIIIKNLESIDCRLSKLESVQSEREDARDKVSKSTAFKTAMVTAIISVFGLIGTIAAAVNIVKSMP
jgi:hypothetical protein